MLSDDDMSTTPFVIFHSNHSIRNLCAASNFGRDNDKEEDLDMSNTGLIRDGGFKKNNVPRKPSATPYIHRTILLSHSRSLTKCCHVLRRSCAGGQAGHSEEDNTSAPPSGHSLRGQFVLS